MSTEPAAPSGQEPAQQTPTGGQTPPSGSGQEPGQQPHTNGTPQGGNGQEPRTFPAAYVHELRQEAARNRTELQAVRQQLDERDQAQMSDLQKAQTKLERESTRANEAELKLARYEVAAEKQIPPEWIRFLTGTTREELAANADALAQQLGGAQGQEPTGPLDFGAGARPNSGQGGEDFNAVLRRAAGRA